jgi:hypothetical protein
MTAPTSSIGDPKSTSSPPRRFDAASAKGADSVTTVTTITTRYIDSRLKQFCCR